MAEQSSPPAYTSDLRRSLLLYGVAVLWLLLWTMVATIEVARLIHDPGVPGWHAATVILISPAIAGAWLAWMIATRRFERPSIDVPRAWFTRQLRSLPLLIAVCILGVSALRPLFYSLIGRDYGGPPYDTVIPLAAYLIFDSVKISLFYGLWLVLVFTLLAQMKRRADSERMLTMQKALAESQLAQLQAQLRPHFLFNALNTVSALMQTDTARADRTLTQLGDLLRASLGTARRDSIPLHEELQIMKKYADIMHERFGERAVVSWNIADNTLDAPLPSMLLQPLLENAYKHGVERNTETVFISITTERNGGCLQVKIHNTGSTLTPESPAGPGVGIGNCRERLRLLYGTAAQLRLEEDGAGGVQAIVVLPCPAPAA